MAEPEVVTLRGLPLLDAAIAHIEAHPETWVQEVYRCSTGMCVAGWMCQLAGGVWIGLDDDDRLYAVPGEYFSYTEDGLDMIEAEGRARNLLGAEFTHGLFLPYNSLADIRRIRDELAIDLAGGEDRG